MTKPLQVERKRLLIGENWVDALSGETFPTLDPANGQALAHIARGSPADVDLAVAAARKAFTGPWSRLRPAERQRLILRLADLVDRDAEELAVLDTLEMGRPIVDSRRVIGIVSRGLRHFAGLATSIRGDTAPNSHPLELLSYTLKEPVGVVAAIIPWNGPLFSAAWKIAPALVTGSTVVLKPSEEGSLTPLHFAALCLEAGIPAGVVNVVTGFGDVGGALSAHMDVDKVSFTGSLETGQKIIQASAGNVKRVTMELGGKSPNIVFADADLDLAAQGSAMAVFANSGQVCAAGTRLYVERSIYDEFVERVAHHGRQLRIGAGIDPETQLGPIVSAKQLDRVTSYFEIGQQEGARIVSGGERLSDAAYASGNFVTPTLFAGVRDDMRIAREEIFGPVVSALPFDTLDEVIERANDSRFGLAAGVWTSNVTKAHQAIRRLRAGSVWINHYMAMDPAMPFGGYRMSGYGKEGGLEHIEAHLETKGVWVRTA